MLSTCASEAPVDRRQAAKLLLLRQQFRLERVQSCGERRPTLPNLVVADQPKLRILRESLGVVRILPARHPTVDPLAQEVSKRQGRVLPPRIGEVLLDEFPESHTFRSTPISKSDNHPYVTCSPWETIFNERLKET